MPKGTQSGNEHPFQDPAFSGSGSRIALMQAGEQT
jgi:hypothetical protein